MLESLHKISMKKCVCTRKRVYTYIVCTYYVAIFVCSTSMTVVHLWHANAVVTTGRISGQCLHYLFPFVASAMHQVLDI